MKRRRKRVSETLSLMLNRLHNFIAWARAFARAHGLSFPSAIKLEWLRSAHLQRITPPHSTSRVPPWSKDSTLYSFEAIHWWSPLRCATDLFLSAGFPESRVTCKENPYDMVWIAYSFGSSRVLVRPTVWLDWMCLLQITHSRCDDCYRCGLHWLYSSVEKIASYLEL